MSINLHLYRARLLEVVIRQIPVMLQLKGPKQQRMLLARRLGRHFVAILCIHCTASLHLVKVD